ncbi:MAG: hypothetical protein KGL39_27290 [Patescibacteria group bacterium]|nr:hypothetical protein [Patescibacteria group bacterium]
MFTAVAFTIAAIAGIGVVGGILLRVVTKSLTPPITGMGADTYIKPEDLKGDAGDRK